MHARAGRIQKELIEERRPRGHVVDHSPHPRHQVGLGLDDLGRQVWSGEPVPQAFSGGVQEHPGKRVADQRIFALGFGRAGRRDAQGRRAHALGDLPGVVVSPGHADVLQFC